FLFIFIYHNLLWIKYWLLKLNSCDSSYSVIVGGVITTAYRTYTLVSVCGRLSLPVFSAASCIFLFGTISFSCFASSYHMPSMKIILSSIFIWLFCLLGLRIHCSLASSC